MPISIQQAAIDLAVAGGLSSLIGFERQWRNRLAGLRTNTLVALGAASFVIFEGLVPGDASPSRVAAQVVSGIGFLGAGLIFREGLSVRGLNTAATIWCSAAVGVSAGASYPAYAALATGFVLFVNLLLRPIVTFINRQPIMGGGEVEVGYLVSVTCRSPDEAHVRALLLQGLAGCGLALRRLDSNDVEGTGRVVVTAVMTRPTVSMPMWRRSSAGSASSRLFRPPAGRPRFTSMPRAGNRLVPSATHRPSLRMEMEPEGYPEDRDAQSGPVLVGKARPRFRMPEQIRGRVRSIETGKTAVSIRAAQPSAQVEYPLAPGTLPRTRR